MNEAFAADDFVWGVYSPTMQRIYAIECLVADSIWDVQRSRRAKVAAYYYTRP